MNDRLIKLEGVLNFRDFGNYRTQDGRLIKPRRLFRSGTFNRPSLRDMERLDQLNIEIVSDLRRIPEREKEPSIWPASDKTRVISGPAHLQPASDQPPFITFLGKPGISPEQTREFAIEAFRKLVFNPLYLHLFSETLKAIANSRGAFIIHCTHGKDRTGILCGLILHIMGVAEDTILADFDLTNSAIDLKNNMRSAHDAFEKRYGIDVPMDVLEPMLGVHTDYLVAAFDAMCERFGSIERYLDNMGIDQATREQIQTNYLIDG